MLNASRLTNIMALAALAALISCVPAEGTDVTNPGDKKAEETEKKAPAPPQPQDIALEGFDQITIGGAEGGMLFSPEGFGTPGMVRVVPKKKTTLAKQRKKQAKAKPKKKATETKVLVTLLWDESRQSSTVDKKKLREEARQLLLAAQPAMGEAFDEVLWQMLFTAEVATGNEEGAAAAGAAILKNYPGSPSAKALAPWIAYFQLRTWKTADAAAVVGEWKLEGLDPLSAYVLAWHHFRARNFPHAVAAITQAATNWKGKSTKPIVQKELILMLARAGTDLETVMTTFAVLSQGEAQKQYEWLYQLYNGYEFAGYREHAADSLERAMALLGDKVPPVHRVSIRQRQFNNFLVAHKPDMAAKRLIEAYNALGPCGQPCAPNADGIAEQIKGLAPHFHATFATTQDERFYAPAKDLYEFYINLGRPDAAQVQATLTNLNETKQRQVKFTGTHDKTTMEWSTSVRNNTIKACYESVLQSEPTLAGSVKLTLEVDDKGMVSGATTDPVAGDAGMAAVGKCLTERAGKWIFPARTKPGKTTLSRTYALSPKA